MRKGFTISLGIIALNSLGAYGAYLLTLQPWGYCVTGGWVVIDIGWTFFFLTNECLELALFINVLQWLARKEDTVKKGFTIFLGIVLMNFLGAYRAYMLTLQARGYCVTEG